MYQLESDLRYLSILDQAAGEGVAYPSPFECVAYFWTRWLFHAVGTDAGIAPSTVDTGFSKPTYVQHYGAFVVQTCQRAEV